MSQSRSHRNEKSKARKNSTTKQAAAALRQRAIDRAMESLESRMLLSVSGFQPAVNYAAGVSPTAVAKGDVNGDGKTDLVIANQVGGNVSVLLGNGNGTFAAPVNYAAGTGPQGVLVADFNGDGKPDIAVANAGNHISVLLNNGNGTFAAPVSYTVGNDPLSIVAGDFTGHGKTDLAVANYQDNTISVLAANGSGIGNGTFAAQQIYSVTQSPGVGTGPNAIVSADFNGDGSLDLAVSDAGGGVSVILSNGLGGFGAAHVFNAGTTPTGLATGFFNGDANADLAVVNATDGSVSILLGAGNGTFGAPTNYNVGSGPLAISAADFNNDGKTDLAVVNTDSNNVSILSGNGNGTFGAATNKAVGSGPQAVAAGDFNGDGSIDLAVVNQADDNVSVLLDKHISVTGLPQDTPEGSALAGVTVATFVDTEAGTVVGDYAASINWGDGTTSAGTITFGNGHYSVAGTHTYADEGVYTLSTTVQDTLGTTSVGTTTSIVRDAALTSTGINISQTEGAPFTGSVATFNDANTAAAIGDFTAVITWGDGTSGSGTIVSDGGGAFHVNATHTWKHKASLPLTIVIRDLGGSKTTATATTTVNDAPLTPASASPIFVEGTSASRTIATFTDANPFGSAAEFSALIHWGDGTPDTTTGVVANGSGYDVVATHTYVHSGNKAASVTITSVDGQTANQNVTVAVNNAAMAATASGLQITEAIPFSNAPVAHFTDANAGAVPGDFTATIDWGDGTPLDHNATVVVDQGNPGFFVMGDHDYMHGGHPVATVTITGAGGTILTPSVAEFVLNQQLSAYGPFLPVVTKATPGELYRGVSGAFNTNTNANLGMIVGSGAGGVTYMPGNGNGTFGAATNYAIGNGVLSVAAADFNGDGKLDIVTANSGGGISVALGNGDGTFAAPTNIALSGDVHDVVVGDFNHDGNLDVATANYAAGTVSVLMGDGSGGFAAAVNYTVGNNPAALTAVDLNGDGKLDLAVVNKGDNTVSVLLNNGDGTFAAPVTYAVGSNPVSVKAGNLDGHIGLVVGNFGDATVSVLKGNGNGTFQSAASYASGLGTQDVALVDLYNTGKVDILTADEGDGTVSILLNKGDGTFAPQMKMPADHSTNGLVTGDFNGDGLTDLIANSFNNRTASVFISDAAAVAAVEGTAFSGNTVLMHFTDTNGAAVAADFPTVSIDWGDGHVGTGTVVANINGGFDVIAGHNYDHAGKKTVITTVTGAGSGVVIGATKVTIANAALAMVANPISPTEGSSFSGVVGHFTDANPAASAGDFTATIVWGDGHTTAGTVVANNGGFDVTGTHTYDEEGTPTFTVSIVGLGGGTASDTNTATVADAHLHSTGIAVPATEGTALTNVLVANFTDDDPAGTAADYTATIHWGDGTTSNTAPGDIVADGSGGFNVTGNHTYLHAGDAHVSVVINDNGGATSTATSTATVANAAVNATPGAFVSTETHSHSQVVANFTDANAAAVAGDFTATIDWGDGTTSNTAPGDIVADGSGGFNVTGAHTYARNGAKAVSVSINGAYGIVASTSFNAAVAIEPSVTAAGITATEGAGFSGTVATFTDSSNTAQAGDFDASINWGDGHTTPGTVSINNGGGFKVTGTHTYDEEGTPSYTVTITSHAGTGGTGNDTATATVADAALSATGIDVPATEGTALNGVVVANFTDADPAGTAADYSATIHWGDGTTTNTAPGDIVADGQGGFNVTGTHTYLHAGSQPILVTINDAGGALTTSSSTATIANAAMGATGSDFAATEGNALVGQIVGHFTDANNAAVIGDFTAHIHWGDGTTSLGTIALTAPGHFSVAGGHTYADAGNFNVTFDVAGNGNGTASSGSVARVANQTITVTGHAFNATEGLAMTNALVATFTDANASAVAGDFAAVISWSDGTTSEGTIVANNSNGFDVTGTHTYAHSGPKVATVTIYGRGGQVLASDGADDLITNGVSTFNNGGLQLINNQTMSAGSVWTATPVSTSAFHTSFRVQIPSGWADAFTFTLQNDPNGPNAIGAFGWGQGYQGIQHSVAINFDLFPTPNQTGLYVNGQAPHGNELNMAANGIDLQSGDVFRVSLDYDGTTLTQTVVDETTSATFVHHYTVDLSASLGGNTAYAGFTAGTGGGNFIGNVLDWNYESNGVSDTANGAVANQTIAVTGNHVSATENTPTGNVLVGTLTDANALASAGDFTATVDWGDASPVDNAVVTPNGSGGFDVTAPSHTYLHQGNKTLTVTVLGAGGGTDSASPTASVDSLAMASTGHDITATEGLTSGVVAVASFTDANPHAVPGDFDATITWGDGHVTHHATIVDNGNGHFDVTGANTYLHAGTAPITVDVTGNGGGTTSAGSLARVANQTITVTGHAFNATEGLAMNNALVATFTDANAAAVAGDFAAVISWSDGTTSEGTIVANNSNGFDVTGTHTYAHSGPKVATVTIYGRGGQVLASDGADDLTNNGTATFQNGGLQLVTNLQSQGGSVWTTTPVGVTAFHTTFDFQLPISGGDGFTFALQSNNANALGGLGGGLALQGINNSVAVAFDPYDGTENGLWINGVRPNHNPSDMSDAGIDLHSGHAFSVTLDYDGTTLTEKVEDQTTHAVYTKAYTVDIAATLGANTGYAGFTGATGGATSIQNILNWNYESNGVSDTANGAVANQTIAVTGTHVSATENTPTGNVLVGTFTDANALASAGDFTATVDWGDASPVDNAVVTPNGSGGFDITAPSHTYLHQGNKTLTVAVLGAGGGTDSASPTASVASLTLSSTGHNVHPVEGSSTGSVAVASFSDPNTNAVANDFDATITWGDGHVTHHATIVDNGNGHFDVTGANTYLHAGTAPITVDVTGNGGGTTQATSTATIDNAVLTHFDGTFVATEGASFHGIIGHFSDANASAVAADFAASIDWGDGTVTSTIAGDIVADGAGGFFVYGTHTYAEEGAATVTTTITGLGGGTAVSTYTSTVADAALTESGSNISAIEGTGFTGKLVANFTDADPSGNIADFTATINWGDGHTTAGTLTADGHGGWNVSGDYLYAVANNYVVTTTIHDTGGASQQAASVAAVAHGTISATGDNVTAVEGTALPGTTLVAHFTDTNLSAIAGNFTASIDWGDGSALDNGTTIASNGSGGFNVTGSHTYLHAGTNPITVTITGAGDTKSANASATVNNNTITITGKVNTAVEGTAFIGTVASFTDANGAAVKGDFTATIDWNDGSAPTLATINDKLGGGFNIAGSHTYTVPGNYAPSVTITGGTGQTFSGQGVLAVADATLNPSSVTIHATEGASFSGTVGTFQDQNHGAVIGDFAATIDWGDGSPTDTGIITANGSGAFTISGAHTWGSAGSRSVTVTIADHGGTTNPSSATISSTAIVADATLTATGQPVAAVEGTPLSGVLVATFADANPLAVAGEFNATITWGDNTGTSVGVVTKNLNTGLFEVAGDHTYAHAGSKTVSVVINDVGGAIAGASSTATIANATLGITAGSVSGIEGQQIISNVANFTDANASAAATDFTATINWGDNATSVGAISDGTSGGFDVLGAHTYAHAGPHTVTVTITGNGGGTVSKTLTANITNAALAGTGKVASVMENHALTGALLASFSDVNIHAVAADFSATIDWKDGTTPDAGVVSDTGNGTFNVTGSHTYLHSGDKAPVVTLTGIGGGSANATGTVHVTNDALSSIGIHNLLVTEGIPFSGAPVAHFTDANPNAAASDFTATIDWGDYLGVDANTTIVANVNGGFDVMGAHDYAHSGSKNISVVITGNGGGTTTAGGDVHVQNATLASTGKTIAAVEGVALSGSTVLAHFTDSNAAASTSDFLAQVTWGDTTSGPANIVANINGGFDVVAAHTYDHAGDKSVGITITGSGGGTTSASSTVHVANSTISATALQNLTITEGIPFSGAPVAHFTDLNANASAIDFTATIDWGDNTALDTSATVVANVNGGFDVMGGHDYLHAGHTPFTVTITGEGPSVTPAVGSAYVQNDPGIDGFANAITVTEGTAIPNGTVLAHFRDPNTAASANDFHAAITWGDGTPAGTGTIVANVNGGFDVTGIHTWAHAGNPTFVVTITGNGGAAIAFGGTAHVHNAALASSGNTLSSVEGSPLSNGSNGAVIAHFTDANASASAGDFAASINWGDGSLADTTNTIVANINGGFDVVANHTYDHAGPEHFTVTITGNGTGVTAPTGTVNVANAALAASASAFTVTEGAPFTGQVVAHFTDANAHASASDFSATINWGDGSAVDTGTTIVASNGGFDVLGGHTYAHAGDKTLSVSISGAGGASVSTPNTAHVANAALTPTGLQATAIEGASFTGVVAAFNDANPAATAGEFSVQIAWGDGSTSGGTIAANNNGGFNVTGTHTYTLQGTKAVVATITGNGGGTAVAHSTMLVNDAALTSTGVTIANTVNVPITNAIVASFTDGNTLDDASHFSAIITWENGVTSVGAIAQTSAGHYNVTGSHTYSTTGSKAVSVLILDGGGAMTTANSTVNVVGAGFTATFTPFTATESVLFSGKVMHFASTQPSATAGSFTALIDWADGTTSAGTIAPSATGGFDVTGSHTWRYGGYKPVSVRVTSNATSGYIIAGGNNYVGLKAMTTTGKSLTGTSGVQLAATIATFTDANTLALAADFTATIAWGDGTSSVATVIKSGTTYSVLATHTYTPSVATTYSAKVTIANVNGLTVFATTKISIAKPVAKKPTVGGGRPPVHHRHHGVGGTPATPGTPNSGAWTKPEQLGHGI